MFLMEPFSHDYWKITFFSIPTESIAKEITSEHNGEIGGDKKTKMPKKTHLLCLIDFDPMSHKNFMLSVFLLFIWKSVSLFASQINGWFLHELKDCRKH